MKIKAFLNDLIEGKEANHSKNSITRLFTKLNNLRRKSSEKFSKLKDFCFEDFDSEMHKIIIEMIDEWSCQVRDRMSVINDADNFFRKSVGGKKFECEFCKSNNENSKGKFDCVRIFKITNNVTNEVLWVGSKCIEYMQINVFDKGEILTENIDEYLNKIADEYEEYKASSEIEIVDFTHKYSTIVLNAKKNLLLEQVNKNPNNEKIMTNYKNFLNNIYKPYFKHIKRYHDLLFILYNNRDNDNLENTDVYSEAVNKFNILLKICQDSGNSNYYIYVPGVTLVINGTQDAMGLWKILLTYLTAYNFNTNPKAYIDWKRLYRINNEIETLNTNQSYKKIVEWINGESNRDDSYPYIFDFDKTHFVEAMCIVFDYNPSDLFKAFKALNASSKIKVYEGMKKMMDDDTFDFMHEHVKELLDFFEEKILSIKKSVKKKNRRKISSGRFM